MKRLLLLVLVAVSLALPGCASRPSGPADPAKVDQVRKRTDQSDRTMTNTRMMGGPLAGVPLGGR